MENKSLKKRTLTPHEVAEYYSIAVGTLANWRCRKHGPKYHKLGSRKILYDIEEIERWIQDHTVLTINSLMN